MRMEKGNTVQVLSANITSWAKHTREIMDEKADIYTLQEVRMTATRIEKARVYCEAQKMELHPGKELVYTQRGGPKHRSPYMCNAGGVAILTKRATCQCTAKAGAALAAAMTVYEH